MLLCPGTVKGMMPLIHQISPTKTTLLERFFFASKGFPRDSSLSQKIPWKKTFLRSLDYKPHSWGQETSNQELTKCTTGYGALVIFSQKAVNTKLLWHGAILSSFTLDFTRKHVTSKQSHAPLHIQVLLKLQTYFTHKGSGNCCTRLWYLIYIYRT